MILSGRELTAEEALGFGLVARLCDDAASAAETAQIVAMQISSRPRIGQLLAKQALSAAMELPLSSGVAFERAAYQIALSTPDARERIAAFAARTSRGADAAP
jgi:enoyl-CoA hydratase/carnithine racemase